MPQPQGEPCNGRARQKRPSRRKDSSDDFPALVRVAANRGEEQNQEGIGAGGQGGRASGRGARL
jgi:hypothetical protein